jgi:hypothetical protein
MKKITVTQRCCGYFFSPDRILPGGINPVFKKILLGYVTVFLAVLRFSILMAVCVGTGFLVVYPLWKLADSNPSAYTLVFTVIFLSLFIWFAGSRILNACIQDRRRFLLSLFRKLTLIAGIGSSVFLVLRYQRGIAAIVLLVTLGVYGFLAFALSPDSNKSPR